MARGPHESEADSAARLEARWHEEIPISAAMGIRVRDYDGASLTVSAALGPNRNVHGTAFAGSLFSLASLCGWGLVFLKLDAAGLPGSIVFVEGSIHCEAPVRSDVMAHCRWDDGAERALRTLARENRSRILLSAQLITDEDRSAARFTGEYAVRMPRRQ